MAPKPKLLIFSGSKKKEPKYACLSEARASHSHKMWAEVPSPTPRFLHRGLSSSPSRWRCLLRVLWPVRRPVTALDWILLKVINFALVPRLGPQINLQACLWVSPRPRHWAPCWLTSQRPSLICKSRLETPRAGSGPRNLRAVPPLASLSAISLPRIPACAGTQKRPIACRIEISFNAFWHWWTKGDVILTALRAFNAAWLSKQILVYFTSLLWDCVSETQAKIAYISAWKTVFFS